MPYSIDTIPGDFPLGYLLKGDVGGHQLYVKERWKGSCPEAAYEEYGGRNPDGSVGEYWQMACLFPGCDESLASVLTTNELLADLRDGLVVGKYRDGLVVLVS